MATGFMAEAEEDEEDEEELEEEELEEEEVGVAGLASSLRACGVLEELPELRGLMEPRGGDFLLLATTPFSRGEEVPLTAGLTAAFDSCWQRKECRNKILGQLKFLKRGL